MQLFVRYKNSLSRTAYEIEQSNGHNNNRAHTSQVSNNATTNVSSSNSSTNANTNSNSNYSNINSTSNSENNSSSITNGVSSSSGHSRRRSTRHRNYLSRNHLHQAVELPDGYGMFSSGLETLFQQIVY